MGDYTPTTEEVMRGFVAQNYKLVPQRDGESFSMWLSRFSIEIETGELQIASEAAARRWLADHDAEVAAKALTDAVQAVNAAAWDEGRNAGSLQSDDEWRNRRKVRIAVNPYRTMQERGTDE
jgi:hypothetical protein